MRDRELSWRSADPQRVSALLAHAPLWMAILEGEEMVVREADPSLADVLGPETAREAVSRVLGPMIVEAIDRVRTAGESFHVTRMVGGRLWEIWLERLDPDRVGLYAWEVASEARDREILHALRNPLYGIRAAVKILLRGDVDPETREVLEHIEVAAGHAEECLRGLERTR